MPDNSALRATIARNVAAVFTYQFTSTIELGGRLLPHGGCLSELDDSDKLEIAGREEVRAQNVSTIAADMVGLKFDEGDPVVLDADPYWQIKKWKLSPDGAVYTFLLLDSR
jgi:hypothetical protein